MKILDRSTVGCPLCSRLPVPNEEDMQWMRSGQPLISLMTEAFEEQKRKAREEAEKINEPEPEADSSKNALESMNSAMDDLEKLFGLDEPEEAEPEPEPEPDPEDLYEPLITEDVKQEPIMYYYQDSVFFLAAHKDVAIQFCPFCGSKFAEKEQEA